MPDVFEYFHTVSDDEIDAVGHASNVAYVEWMQAAAIAHSTTQGWPSDRYLQSGFGWVVRSHKIEYHRPALPGDDVVVETWVATMEKATSIRRYRIVRRADSLLLATAETKWAFVNYATGLPKRIPPELAQSFSVVAR